MSNVISRRDFLKASSAVGLAAAVNPASALASSTKKSRVVIATDTAAVTSSGSPVAAKIQDLVDHAIMTFTGKADKASAYAALFPSAITNSAKIYIKRNDASGRGTVNKSVTDAFQNGLLNMLSGTFPKANIDNPDPLPSNGDYTANTSAATYIVNCPVAWCHSLYGVTLSLKNQMNYLGKPIDKYHSKKVNGKYTWLWEVGLDPKIKPKQVLSLMDAVVGDNTTGPTSKPKFKGYTIIVSNDLVAVDYHTINLMKSLLTANQLTDTTIQAYYSMGESQLKDAEKAGLGTCTEANMEVIKITAPWGTVGTINGSDKIMRSLNIRVIHQGNKVDFVIPGASSKHVSIFDMAGNAIWQSQNLSGESVSWNQTTMFGARAPSGMYVYRIACNGSIMRGTVMRK